MLDSLGRQLLPDGDKYTVAQYPDLKTALQPVERALAEQATVIVVDNVVRTGKIIDTASSDESVKGIRRFYKMLAAERRVSATAIQTVGSKGYDGVAIARVVGSGAIPSPTAALNYDNPVFRIFLSMRKQSLRL